MATVPLHKLFEKEHSIRKRFKKSKSFVHFPAKKGGDDAEDVIGTRSMEMNVAALKVMFSFFKVTSGKRVPIEKLENSASCPKPAQIIFRYLSCQYNCLQGLLPLTLASRGEEAL